MRHWFQQSLQEIQLKSLIGLVLLLPLSACYVPNNYGTEVRITRDGNYGIFYSGELTWAPLYSQIARGEIEEDAAAEQVIGFTDDLKRDTNFKSVVSLGRGRFRVRYDRQGTITRTTMISFVRRNSRIFELHALEDGQVKFIGSSATSLQADQLEAIGIKSQGLLRITTDAPVSEHNAMSVRPASVPGYVMYDWNISSLRQPGPKLTLQLSRTLPSSPGT